MAIVATLFCQKCGDKIVQYQGARFTICNKCGFQTEFTTNQNVTKYDTVTLRTDEREEVDAIMLSFSVGQAMVGRSRVCPSFTEQKAGPEG